MVAACPACSDQSMVRACCKPCRLAGRWTATKAHYSSLIQPYKTKRICSLAVACVKFCCACLPDSRSMRDPFNFPFTTAHNSPKNTGQSAPCPKRKPVVHLHLTTTEAGEALRANGVPASVCAPSTGLDLSTASREKCQYRGDPENGGFRSSKHNTPMAHLCPFGPRKVPRLQLGAVRQRHGEAFIGLGQSGPGAAGESIEGGPSQKQGLRWLR